MYAQFVANLLPKKKTQAKDTLVGFLHIALIAEQKWIVRTQMSRPNKKTILRSESMGCKYSKYDGDIMRFKCRISGSECIYFIPNEKKCEEAIDMNESVKEEEQ